jgi:hypothetical protein
MTMTITCDHVDSVLSAWFEGDLGPAERRAVDAHLRECLRCAALVRDIEAIRRDAANLPPLEPSRDLWQGIGERIEAPVIELKPRQAPAPGVRAWQMAAAAVVLMAVSSGATYLLTSGQSEGGAQQFVVTRDTIVVPRSVAAPPNVISPQQPRPSSGSTPTVLVSTQPSAPEVMYDQEISRLRVILDERRNDLDTATVAALEKSLRAIDQAIIDAKTALAGNGQNAFLTEQLNRALEKKVSVLRRAALLPVGAGAGDS